MGKNNRHPRSPTVMEKKDFSIRTRTKDKDKEVISSPREIVPFFSLYLVLVPNPNPELVKYDPQSDKTFENWYITEVSDPLCRGYKKRGRRLLASLPLYML